MKYNNQLKILFILMFFQGCAPIEHSMKIIGPPVKIDRAILVSKDAKQEVICLQKDLITIDKVSRDKFFIRNKRYILPKGKYVLIASNSEGKYYKIKDQITYKKKDVSDSIRQGFFVPYNNKNQWILWRYPNSVVSFGAMTIYMKEKENEFIRYAIIKKSSYVGCQK